jgi:N-sulfoglucosamine sulfohydrolase
MWARLKSGNTPWDVARDETRFPLKRFLEAASVVGRDDATHLQRDWLHDANDGMRYWAAVGLHAAATLSEADRSALREALRDSSSVVRIESAAALARHGEHSAALATLSAALRDELPETVLHAARGLELLGPSARPVYPEMRAALATAREREAAGDEVALFIRFSLEAALSANMN